MNTLTGHIGPGPIILAIETATTACAIGLHVGDNDSALVLDTQRRHTEVLTAGIESALSSRGLTPSHLDRIVVDHGPGLFTGLRVGLATAQAMADALDIELVAVSSLELLAAGAARAGVTGTISAAVDARRGEIFAQRFQIGESLVPSGEPVVTTAKDLAMVWATSGEPVTVTGDGAIRYRDWFDVVANVSVFEQSVPPVLEALVLGAEREGSSIVTPMYLREADAVANFTTRQRST